MGCIGAATGIRCYLSTHKLGYSSRSTWITELLRLEKTFKIFKSNLWPNTTVSTKPEHWESYPVFNQLHIHFTLGDHSKNRSLTTLNWGRASQKAGFTETSLRETAVVGFLVYWISNLALFAHLCSISACCLIWIPENACYATWTKDFGALCCP